MPEALRTTTPNVVTCSVYAAEESLIVVEPKARIDEVLGFVEPERFHVRVTGYEGRITDAVVTLTRDQLASLVAQARVLLEQVAA